jgi:chromosome partitioning protein
LPLTGPVELPHMHTLAIYSMKGGVGKTAAAVNLGYLAAQTGRRVLLWDLDPQAASTFYFRVKPKGGGARKLLSGKVDLDTLIKASDFDGLDLLPARFSFRKADLVLADKQAPAKRFAQLLAPLAPHYDLLIFDCAPGLSTMSEAVLASSDLALVPVIPTPLSLRTLTMLTQHTRGWAKPEIVPFFSMVDRRKQLHKDILAAPARLSAPTLLATIPYASQVERMGLTRAPLGAFAGGCAAFKAYRALWDELASRLFSCPPRR